MYGIDSGGTDQASNVGCIYCGLKRPFNDEHVFPAGLGGDDRAFMLRGLVCKTCNSETFSRMEAGLMRNSPEAFARVHSQPRGRNRKKSSSGPKFQPESTTAFLPDGGDDVEAEIRAGGQVFLLPQFSLREKQLQGQGSDISELQKFAVSLQVLFSEDSLFVVTKNAGAEGANYSILTYHWDGVGYRDTGKSISTIPPAVCIWKDQRSNDNVPNRPHRIFRRSGGQVVLRAGDKDSDSEFLTIMRRSCQEIIGVTNNAGPGKTITGASIMVQMNASFIDRERVFAKIGLNLCAFVFGATFVRQRCFDDIKSRILSGASPVSSRDHHLQHMEAEDTIARIFSAAPPQHHLCMLTAVQQPDGGIAIGFSIRLYGGVLTTVSLTDSAPFPMPNTPIFMLVDYSVHKVSVLSLGDFVVKYLAPRYSISHSTDIYPSLPGAGHIAR